MSQRKLVYYSASEERLYKLIQQRLEKGANKQIIDQRIWDLFGEDWCIMFTDLAGFSRNVEKFGIIHFLQTIHLADELLVPVIEAFDGIILKTEGDSYLVIFRNVSKAVHASIEMQQVLQNYNSTVSTEEQVLLCVGLGFGKVLRIGDSDVYGFEVNSASKLGEDIAEAGDILVTVAVKDRYELGSTGDMTEKDEISLGFEKLKLNKPGLPEAYKVVY